MDKIMDKYELNIKMLTINQTWWRIQLTQIIK